MSDVTTMSGAASGAASGVTPPRMSKAQMNVVFLTILLGMLLSALDQTIVSTALPTIVSDLGGGAHMSWVVTSYMLAETISTVLAGKFGDLFGRKRIFQLSVLIFIVGSFFCGLAEDMTTLIIFRGVQGIGGGGLAVTATALIGEVIPLRERGKYQGALGAVFGVTTVLGPLLGGLFTDHLSWRWAFYVNVPIAIIVILLAARTIPGGRGGRRPKIDYLGVLFVSLGASGLILATSWGGTQYPWGSATIIGLFGASLISLAIFVWVEIRAEEPILPMRLFRGRVFTVASILSFVVGFAMMGSITFLPTFLQYVSGASATSSGLRMLPMVIGLLLTAIASGNAVGRTGRYRMFPIAGAAVTALGLYLMSLLDQDTPLLVESVYFFVLGAGIGLIMQILTLIVQNTTDYRDLGTATSGVTFFRTLGGSFGAAVLGSIYSNNLADRLPVALVEAPGVSPQVATSPEALWALPEATRAPVVEAYAASLHNVFLWAVPVALLALVVAFFLPQVTLRGTDRASGTGEGFAIPEGSESDTQLENVIGQVLRKKGASAAPEVLAASGTALDLPTSWGVMGVYLRDAITGGATQSSIERSVGVPPGVLRSFFDEIVTAGYLTRSGDVLRLTGSGQVEVDRIVTAWRSWLLRELEESLPAIESGRTVDDPTQAARINAAVDRMVVRLVREDEVESAPAEGR
ncbi:MDR family MFS transporter [Nakamurella sp. GG22]